MSLSVRGITRHYLGTPATPDTISIRQLYYDRAPWMPGNIPLRPRLILFARREYKGDISECIFKWTAAYEQTWSQVRVRIQLAPDSGISDSTMATLRTRWGEGIRTTWSNRWGVGRPGEIALPINIQVEWVDSNAHHVVRVRSGTYRSNMTLWCTADNGNVAAHEVGHMMGYVDEYKDPDCPKRSPVGTGTVMDNNTNLVPERLVQMFANNIGSNIVRIP